MKGGLVVDGTTAAPQKLDLLVEGDRISGMVQNAETLPDDLVLDAEGCLVTPGFIDIHSHSDYTLVVDGRAHSALLQGVTTEVIGNCGHGCFPVHSQQLGVKAIYGFNAGTKAFASSAGDYLALLEASSPAVNVATLTPHGQMRLSMLGASSRHASRDEHRAMCELLASSLDEGSWGFSTGLEYAVERAASPEEIVDFCRIVADRGALYATHTRFRNEGAESGVAEAIQVAEESGCRLQISHLVPRGGYDQTLRCLELVEVAQDKGIDVQFDMHTRLHGFTYLHVGAPAHLLEGSPSAIAARLATPEAKDEIRSYRAMFNFEQDADRIVISAGLSDLHGLSIREVADVMAVPPLEAGMALLIRNAERLDEVMVNLPTYTVEQQLLAFTHPLGVPASDATTLCLDGPLGGRYFPGAFSWAAYSFSLMYEGLGEGGLPTIISKLSSQPAARVGIQDRGRIAVGLKADIAAFKAREFGASFGASAESPAVGMRHVVVNGQPSVLNGQVTGARAGRVLLS